MSKNISLSLNMSEDFYNLLDHLAEQSHTSKSEIFKRAIMLMKVAIDEERKGNYIGIIGNDKNLITQIHGISKK